MTVSRSPLETRARRPRRERVAVRWLIRVAIVALIFGLGVAVGQALEDRPRPSKPVTNVSTVRPWTQTEP